MGAAFAKMKSLESLWLSLVWPDDQLHADRTGLTAGIAAVKTLKLLHADIACMPCQGSAWQCSNPGGPLASVINGTCVDCNVYPAAEECNCWLTDAGGCSVCDGGNYPAGNWSECNNWP